MAAHQAPLSLGFSRQEHWSGLPFPSPVHESEKWKWSCSVVSDSLQPRGLQPTRPLRPWDFPGKSTGVGCHCLLWTKPTGYNKDPVQSKNKIKLRKKNLALDLLIFCFPDAILWFLTLRFNSAHFLMQMNCSLLDSLLCPAKPWAFHSRCYPLSSNDE